MIFFNVCSSHSISSRALALSVLAGASVMLGSGAFAQGFGSDLQGKLDHMSQDALVLADEFDALGRALDIIDLAADPTLQVALDATNSVWSDGFGHPYDLNTSYFGSLISTMPGVFALQSTNLVSISEVEDLSAFPVQLPTGSLDPTIPAGLVQTMTWSGKIGQSDHVIGTATILDLTQLPAANLSDPNVWTVLTFTPLAIVDPASSVSPEYAAEFLALVSSEAFTQPGDMLGWLGADGSLTFEGSVFDSGGFSSGDMDGGFAARSEEAFWECIIGVHMNYRQKLMDLATEYRAAAIPLEDKIKEFTAGPLGHVLIGGGAGGATGAAGGAAVGGIPTGGIGTLPGALLGGLFGATIGAAGGLATWAFGLDADELEEARKTLKELKEVFERKACDEAKAAGAAMKECILDHCPELGDQGNAAIDAWVASQGC